MPFSIAQTIVPFDVGSNKRRALLIGNDSYYDSPLDVCCNDAKDLGYKMQTIGFRVSIATDVTYNRMKQTILSFVETIEEEDFIVFFFSGHGIQRNGQNYLTAVTDVQNQRITPKIMLIRAIVNKIMERRPSLAIFLFDCCRNDTIAQFTGPEFNQSNVVICFACSASQTASARSLDSEHSLFTSHLIRNISKVNLTVFEVLTNTTRGVIEDAKKLGIRQQQPIFNSTIPHARVYFHEGGKGKSMHNAIYRMSQTSCSLKKLDFPRL